MPGQGVTTASIEPRQAETVGNLAGVREEIDLDLVGSGRLSIRYVFFCWSALRQSREICTTIVEVWLELEDRAAPGDLSGAGQTQSRANSKTAQKALGRAQASCV